MPIRTQPDWLDRILDLVERHRVEEGVSRSDALPDARHDGPQWDLNHEFWLEQLRAETGSSWSDDQYADAARLLNFADQRQAILHELQQLIAQRDAVEGGAFPHALDSGILALIESIGDQLPLVQGPEGSGSASASDASPDPATSVAEVHGRKPNSEIGPDTLALRAKDGAAPLGNQIRADLAVQAAAAAIRIDRDLTLEPSAERPPVIIEIRARSEPEFVVDPAEFFAIGQPRMPEIEARLVALADAAEAAARLASQDAASYTFTEPARSEVVNWLRGGGQSAAVRDLDGPVLAIEQETATVSGRVLVGSDDNDVLTGSSGDDLIAGGAGDDVLSGGDGDDVITGGAGNDRISGGKGDDRIAAGAGNDIVSGGLGDDVIAGGAGADVLRGDPGDDLVDGGSGDDDVSGGSGNDIVEGGSGDDGVTGGDGDDGIDGGSGHDQLDGGEGSDTVYGGAGDDVLRGGAIGDEPDRAADLLVGGLGNDTIYINDEADAAVEHANEGTDTVATTLNVYVLPDNIEVLIFVGSGPAHATGNEIGNLIIGTAGNDWIDGAGGADTLAGSGGDDRYSVDHAGDVVVERYEAGTDQVEATLNVFVLPENIEVLVYSGAEGFEGAGNELDNVIVGGDLDDFLEGLGGKDSIFGGDGDDWIDGGDGDDWLDGGDGDDVILAAGGDDFVLFTRGNDTLVLRPGFGNDTVLGFDADSEGSGGRDHIDVRGYGMSADAFGTDILLVYDGEATIVKIGGDSVKLLTVEVDSIDRNSFIFS